MLTATLTSIALAATVTEIPPFLRGDIEIDYSYDRLAGALEERGEPGAEPTPVGTRRVETHQLRYGAVFGAAPGLAIFVNVPHDAWSGVSYDSWSKMVYDPSTGSGTYVGSNAQETSTPVVGSGVQGAWIGLRGTPFSEAFKSRENRATWLLEGAVRTPNPSNQYAIVTPSTSELPGEHGAGPGGLGLRVRSAFSTTFNKAQPYVSFAFTAEDPSTITIADDQGHVLNKNVEIDPGDNVRTIAGVELTAGENAANGSRFAVDLHVVFDYTSSGNVPTGEYLPGVLVPDAGVVQTAESLEAGGGLGLIWRPFQYMQLNLHGDVAGHVPQRIENGYSVYTGGDTIRLVAGSDLTIRVR